MLKIMLNVYLWSIYILCAPLIALWSIGLIAWTCVMNKKDIGEFDFKESIKAYVGGLKEGHNINKCNIDLIADK